LCLTRARKIFGNVYSHILLDIATGTTKSAPGDHPISHPGNTSSRSFNAQMEGEHRKVETKKSRPLTGNATSELSCSCIASKQIEFVPRTAERSEQASMNRERRGAKQNNPVDVRDLLSALKSSQ
jgi:hypothetical protein